MMSSNTTDDNAESGSYDAERERQARTRGHRTLLSAEIFWRDHQIWLAQQGYMLRPRYRPYWEPSWEGEGKAWRGHEDGVMAKVRESCFDPVRGVEVI